MKFSNLTVAFLTLGSIAVQGFSLDGMASLFKRGNNPLDAIFSGFVGQDNCKDDITMKILPGLAPCYMNTVNLFMNQLKDANINNSISNFNPEDPDFKNLRHVFDDAVETQMNLLCDNRNCTNALVDSITLIRDVRCDSNVKEKISSVASSLANPDKDPLCDVAEDGSTYCATYLLKSLFDLAERHWDIVKTSGYIDSIFGPHPEDQETETNPEHQETEINHEPIDPKLAIAMKDVGHLVCSKCGKNIASMINEIIGEKNKINDFYNGYTNFCDSLLNEKVMKCVPVY